MRGSNAICSTSDIAGLAFAGGSHAAQALPSRVIVTCPCASACSRRQKSNSRRRPSGCPESLRTK
jgi:hypothetical protein